MKRYPRNMTGYAATPPDAAWPNNAKIAVQIVLNYEEGGENCILHGDAASEGFLSEITNAQPWPGQRHWNMESIYEYGARAGFWRVHRLLKDTPVTVYGVATALARAPEQVAAMQAAGWEIASHGLKWIEHKDMDREAERSQIREAIRLHTEVTGTPPRGWYTGRCSMNTVDLAAEEGNLAYIADSYADDLPYWVRAGGKDQLIVPYTMDCNDMRFAIQAGFTDGRQFEGYLKDSFDTLYAEGQAGSPKMLSIGLHCRLTGRPGRAAALKRVLEYFRSHADVWFTTRAAIADHWAARHPPEAGPRPSEMDRAAFVAQFGGVFEHSPWIAEAAFDLELGPTHDTATGVHSALARVFRSASEEARLGVLTAHPDLAGKLSAAKRLTAESTAEQASAGLDALTDAERARFTTLNDAYSARFGFPFIIAVRDHDTASIMAAFERRLQNDRDTEFAEACRQVERIAALRLAEKLGR
ncbi:MAG: polysaccharide deacetylase [Rhodobacteraceae bacterium CG17_big_fil_post_rev_8_21_14_2_50_65_11]|nr:MAG: polysaccharide deacetylase [Rhodobacteraceae bacterium CG17_big_fil_post_rev_8_21_14_2_50_65_11]